MKRLASYLGIAVVLAAAGIGVAMAQGGAPAPHDIVRPEHPGRAHFEANCAPCHGIGRGDDGSPMLPGTAALAVKYGGERPGQLELRDDLPPAVLQFFVRRGIGAMPGFRKSELSDAEIEQIAGYLLATAKAN